MVELIIRILQSSGIDYGFFRLINYLTFRALMGMASALLFCLLFGFRFILFLYRKKFRDTSGETLSINAYSKRGTPTAGGLLILSATLFSLILWGSWENRFLHVLVIGYIYLTFVGFLDDFQKTRFKSSLSGLSQMGKTLLLLLFLVPYGLFFLSPWNPVPEAIRTQIFVPFYKHPVLELTPLAFFLFLIFAMFSIINAVNITDGMDGLLGTTSILSIGVYSFFSYIVGNAIASGHYIFPFIRGSGEIAVFGATLIGGIMGFLWYNTYPAEVFMGDTGSLGIGGALAMMAFFTKQEMLFPLVGGVFLLEIFTSLIQEKVGYRMHRRLVYRAPFHHSLTHRGTAEPKVVIRLVIVAIVLSLLSLLSLKVR